MIISHKHIVHYSVALLTLILLVSPFAFTHASELDISDYFYTSYYEDVAPSYSDYMYTSYYDTQDIGSYGGGYNYTSPSYSPSQNYPGYSSPNFSMPSFSLPYHTSYSATPSNTNTNTCTGNSCNTIIDDHSVWQYVDNTCSTPNSCSTNIDDHSVFNAPTNIVVTNPAPQTQTSYSYPIYVPTYTPSYPTYLAYPTTPIDVCPNIAGYQTTGPCYQNYNYPTPTYQPYVSLSAVPYTGLELGVAGTIAYWGFLILWCLVACDRNVVKRVREKILSGLNAVIFGSTALTASGSGITKAPAKVYTPAVAAKVTEPVEEGTDAFILSQIKR